MGPSSLWWAAAESRAPERLRNLLSQASEQSAVSWAKATVKTISSRNNNTDGTGVVDLIWLQPALVRIYLHPPRAPRPPPRLRLAGHDGGLARAGHDQPVRGGGGGLQQGGGQAVPPAGAMALRGEGLPGNAMDVLSISCRRCSCRPLSASTSKRRPCPKIPASCVP